MEQGCRNNPPVVAALELKGYGAWQHCNRLLTVHLPNSLVCLKDGAFRRCYALHTVTAPECRYFGSWVFEECHALAHVGDQNKAGNQLAPQARFRTLAFEKCRALQRLHLRVVSWRQTGGPHSPADFSWTGPQQIRDSQSSLANLPSALADQ